MSGPPSPDNDDWRPTAARARLELRAKLLAAVRAFFAARGVLEIETPVLSTAAATDPQLASLTTRYTGPAAPAGRPLYLHTSPEFPMKRLLAAGSGDIYQVCKVFRDGEAGRRHNPEFTLLEWYRVGWDHRRLMDEVEALVTTLLAPTRRLEAPERLTYGDAFQRHLGVDPHRADGAALAERAAALGIGAPRGLGTDDLDGWRDLLWTACVEPRLGRARLTFVDDYPASQAALARVQPGEPAIAERFELYLDGVELANGFHELADPGQQAARFERDLKRRRAAGLAEPPQDARLLAALVHGLPDCAGVALGVDRLVMLAAGVDDIRAVLAFPIDRA
ncbi:MAG TPA: EF-P lysine aminoacylase EpmA [Acidiferrobacterales bacterium]